MTYRLEYKNYTTFLKKLEKREWSLIKKIIESILEAVSKKKKKVHVFEVFCIEENCIYDFSIEENQYKQILEKGLQDYIDRELYEDCSLIKKVIDNYDKNIKTSTKILPPSKI